MNLSKLGIFAALLLLGANCSSDRRGSNGSTPLADGGGDGATPVDVSASVDGGDAGVEEDPLGAACADALETIPPDAWHPERRINPEHRDLVSDVARICLTNYVQIDTTNPPTVDHPGEIAAVRFFETVFRRLGMSTQRAPMSRDPDPKRLSVVATREGQSDLPGYPSLLLLNHTDVVPAEGDWTHDPFGGHFDGENVWGRGALDMKGIGISQLVALTILHRSGIDLGRDIHFAAVADEEVGGQGGEYIAATRLEGGVAENVDPLGLNPGVVLNEGGNGVRDDLVPRRDVFVVGVEEKGKVWTQFGHQDPGALAAAIVKLGVIPAPAPETFGPADLRTTLGDACTLTNMMSDSQKANVQPMSVQLDFECQPGMQSDMEDAVATVGEGLEVTPTVTVEAAAAGATETLSVTIAFGIGGHGAAGVSVNVLNLATSALVATGVVNESEVVVDETVRDRYFDWILSPANQTLVSRLARDYGETASEAADAFVTNPRSASALLDLAHSFLPIDSPFKTSCSWTNVRFEAGSEAFAKLDCRLNSNWPDAEAFEAELAGFMSQHGVSLRSKTSDCFDCSFQDFNSSPFGPNVDKFALVEYLVERSSPDALVTPYLFPASSDSYWYRAVDVPVYAIWPIALGQEELEAIHAIDERVPLERMTRAIDIYAQMIDGLANDLVPPPADRQHKLDAETVSCSRWDPDGQTWVAMDTNTLECNDLHFHCTVADDAPRFLRARASVLDVKVTYVRRMKPGFELGTELVPSDGLDVELYRSRNLIENGAIQDGTRVFPDQEFEIDTGAGVDRSFMLHCGTPLHQILAEEDLAELDFYRD